MKEEEIIKIFTSFCKPQEFPLIQELVSTTEKRLLKSWYLLFLTYDFRDFKAIVKSLFALLEKESKKKAEVSKIKSFKGSREQEKQILSAFWLEKQIQKMPEWFKGWVWKT